jgi:hypothetical protein
MKTIVVEIRNTRAPTYEPRLHSKSGADRRIAKISPPVILIRIAVSSAKCVFKISRWPSRLKSPTPSPVGAIVSPPLTIRDADDRDED